MEGGQDSIGISRARGEILFFSRRAGARVPLALGGGGLLNPRPSARTNTDTRIVQLLGAVSTDVLGLIYINTRVKAGFVGPRVLFFLAVAVFGGLFVVNLFLAVIFDSSKPSPYPFLDGDGPPSPSRYACFVATTLSGETVAVVRRSMASDH